MMTITVLHKEVCGDITEMNLMMMLMKIMLVIMQG